MLAGCTSIEHGNFVKDDTLKLMAERGTYFDPNLLVLHNYLDNRVEFQFHGCEFQGSGRRDPGADRGCSRGPASIT